MPAVAANRSPSGRPSERSSSAVGGGVSWYGPVKGSPNVVVMARANGPHSSAVMGRSWSARSSTGGVYPAGTTLRQRVPGQCRPPGTRCPPGPRSARGVSAAQVGQGGEHPTVLVLVGREAELGEDVLGVL